MKSLKHFGIAAVTLSTIIIACNSRSDNQSSYNESYKQKADSISASQQMAEPPAPDEEKAMSKNADTYQRSTDKDEERRSLKISEADNVAISPAMSSTAARVLKDTTKKFIRTADLKFRVDDVVKSTLAIEDITAHFGGFVTYTNLESSVSDTRRERLSADSSAEIIRYTLRNDLVLRIPNAKLDSALREIGKLVAFFDYRKIQAQDITIDLISSKKREGRERTKSKRITNAIESHPAKLYDATDAENSVTDAIANADDAEIERMRLMDDVAYSKVVINLYQLPVVSSTVVVSDGVYDKYKPSFGYRLQKALLNSWYGLLEVLLFFANIWCLVILAGVAIWVARKYGKTKFKQKPTA